MMKFLFPKEPAFAEHFKQLNGYLHDISKLFDEFAHAPFENLPEYLTRASEIEHQADGVTHTIISELNRSFITPFDREDILELAHEMDDIVDLIENVMRNLQLYHISATHDALPKFSKLTVEASVSLDHLIQECFSHTKHTEKSNSYVIRLHELEDQGDVVFEQAISHLFSTEKDPISVIKWKDLLENMEEIMDKFQSISNTMESILVKSS